MKTTNIIVVIAMIVITALFVCYLIGKRRQRRPIEPLKLMVAYPTMISKAVKKFVKLFTIRRIRRDQQRLIAEIIRKAESSERVRVYHLSDLEFIDRYGQELHDELLAAHDEQKEQLLMLEI